MPRPSPSRRWKPPSWWCPPSGRTCCCTRSARRRRRRRRTTPAPPAWKWPDRHASSSFFLAGTVERQVDTERRAAPRGGGHVHLPPVGGDDGGDDAQPQPGAAVMAGAGRVGPVEALEDPARLLGGEAGPVVGHLHQRLVAVLAHRDP